ncbi:unnamed protein product, partial [Discosporangium mesarthrocarpum]
LTPTAQKKKKLEYVPLKINSRYVKTVTVINRNNPLGNVSVEVRGSNADKDQLLLHSHFYKVGNRMRQQQVYFDHMVTGSPALRILRLQNISDRPLLFKVEPDTAEIQVRVRVRVGLEWN